MTPKDKTKKMKELFLEQIRRTPIIESTAEKVGVTRQTVHRWKKDDPDFALAFDEALRGGRERVNDVAISQLLTAIKDGNMQAIMFWLKHFDEDFKTKIEITGTLKQVREAMTPEETATMAEALRFMSYSQEQIETQINNLK